MSLHGFRAVGYDGVVGGPGDIGIQGERNDYTDYTADKLGADERQYRSGRDTREGVGEHSPDRDSGVGE